MPPVNDGPVNEGPANESPASAAVAYVAARSEGGPIDRSLRVTVNFHPDRLVGDELMIGGSPARTDISLSSRQGPAPAG